MKKVLVIFSLFSIFPLFIFSQGVGTYTATRQTGITFTSIDGTGTAVTAWRAGENSGNNRSQPIPIGFSFSYLGTLYAELSVSTNGFIDFSSNTAAGYADKPYGFDNTYFSAPAPDGTLLAIAPFYDDLMITWGFTLQNAVKYQTTGAAGSRVFTIEWVHFSFEQSVADHLNFQVKLYEADAKIEFIYGEMSASAITPGYTCGINTLDMSVPPTAAQLLTQQTANSATFSATPQNSLGTIPANNSKITLTGCILPGAAGTISGPANVCQSSTGLIYSLPAIPNATNYTWTLPAGFTITSGTNTSSITVSTGTTAAAGNISVAGSNSCGNGTSSSLPVTIAPRPAPTITGPVTVCAGITGNTYTTQASMSNYQWAVTSGGTIVSGAGTNAINVTWNTAGAEAVSVNYTNSSGCSAAVPVEYLVTVNANPQPAITGPNSICANTTGNVYNTQPSMSNYIWTVSPGGTITAGGTSTSNNVTVSWSTAGAKSVSVNFTNANGCTSQAATLYPVTVNPIPVPTITGPASSCINSTANVYTTQSGMTNYLWSISPGGTITGGGTTGSNSVDVTWTTLGAKTISVNYTGVGGCTGTAPAVYNVTVNPRPSPTISGPGVACAGSIGNVYTTQSAMAAYAWVISAGGTIIAGGSSTSSSTTVKWNTAGQQSVSVNYNNSFGCPALNPAIKQVTVNPQPTPILSGPVTVCAGTSGHFYSTEPGMTNYGWIVSPGGTITAGGTSSSNSVTIKWNTSGLQTVKVNYNNSFGCSSAAPTVFTVTVDPLPVPTITGPSLVCSNTGGHVYTTENGMPYYLWNISAGGTITGGGGSNSIIVTWNSGGARSVNVSYTNLNGCTSASATIYTVTVSPAPIPSITGPSSVCVGTSGHIYATASGMTNYQWTISPGGVINSGATGNTVTVSWNLAGAQTIGVGYTNQNGCTSPVPNNKTVTVYNLPVPVITGNPSPCVNSGSYLYSTESGMTNYQWTVSSGGLITSGSGTNILHVSWIATGMQWVAVSYINPAGCAAITPTIYNLNVIPTPGAAGVVNGISNVCTGANGIAYSVGSIPNALTYLWNLPAGASIASGAGTQYITVNFSATAVSGNISVMGTNGCSGGAPSPPFPVTVSSKPGPAGPITGLDSVARGAAGIPYYISPIPGATGYFWTVPPGATIKSGANTDSITLDFSTSATSGNVKVSGTNLCGVGTTSPIFHITMMPPPAPPVITQAYDYLHSNYSVGNQWYRDGNLISGATGQTYLAIQNGLYWDIVTRYGMQSGRSNQINVIVTGIEEITKNKISVYPVPNDGRFTVSINNLASGNIKLLVYNQIGSIIYNSSEMNIPDNLVRTIDLRPLSPGVYTLVIQTDDQLIVKKLVVKW